MELLIISSIIGGALTALQMGMSAANSINEGQQRQQNALRNEANAQLASEDARARGENAAALTRAQASMDVADMQAAYGASGVDGTVGSPMDALRAYRRKTDLDILTLRNNAAREAWGYKLQADAASAEGRLAALRTENEVAGTLLGGSGKLIEKAGSTYSNLKLLYPEAK
jgi:hypothetical protein